MRARTFIDWILAAAAVLAVAAAGRAAVVAVPEKGQSAKQQRQDEDACTVQALKQSGGVQGSSAGAVGARRHSTAKGLEWARQSEQAKRQLFDQAYAACMKDKGYKTK